MRDQAWDVPQLQQHPSPGAWGTSALLQAEDECLGSFSTTPVLPPLEPTNLTSSLQDAQFLPWRTALGLLVAESRSPGRANRLWTPGGRPTPTQAQPHSLSDLQQTPPLLQAPVSP